MLSREEELRLIEDAKKGDEGAWDELFANFKGVMVSHVHDKLNKIRRVSDHDAEEITQSAWVDIVSKLSKPVEDGGYDPQWRFFTYVKNFLKFRILQHLQRLARDSKTDSMDDENGSLPEIEAPAGAGRQPEEALIEKERLRLRLDAYSELLSLVFLCGGYPHRQLAFLHSKQTFGGKTTEGDIYGKPSDVDKDFGAKTLKKTADEFWIRYGKQSGLPPAYINELKKTMKPLELRFPLTVGELVKLSKDLSRQLKPIAKKKVGTTHLKDYYSDKGYAAISDWCHKVRGKVHRVLGIDPRADEGEMIKEVETKLSEGEIEPICTKNCTLRHIPPCGGKRG
jgi:hypothetical protein